jgi:hypothetical protein
LLAGNINVTVLQDVNANGVRDAGDTPLVGWTTFIDLNRNGVKETSEPAGVTGTDGQFLFTGLADGTYDVREAPPAGWLPAAGFSLVDRISARNGRTDQALFMNVPATSGGIDGTLWNDLNGDGVRAPADVGIPGWTVYLDLNTNNSLDAGEPTSITDAAGFYSFPNLAPATYKMRFILAGEFNATVGFNNGVQVVVPSGTTAHTTFGVFSLNSVGNIAGTVFNDVNADGTRAATDPGLSGWQVYVDLNNNGAADAGEPSALTDPAGGYSFPSLVVGTYTVRMVNQSGWNLSPGNTGARTVTVVGQTTSGANFGVWTPTPGGISGRVYNDANGDGFLGAGESGVSGWTVFVDANSNGTLDAGELSAVSDATGAYTIAAVPTGAFDVREIPQVGWTPTAPATAVQLVNVPNGTTVGNVLFGNKQRTDGEIHGVAFADYDQNGVRGPAEKGLAGITVYLDLNDNGNLDATEPSMATRADLFYTPAVNEAGQYEFTHLAAGTYKVRTVVPAILSATLESARSQSITLLVGEIRNNADFAMRFRGNEIHGHKFNDVNGNGHQDAGEPGVPGVTIYLDTNRNDVLDADEPRTVTAADGSYGFVTGLSPTSYVVREILPWGWQRTYPATPGGGVLWPAGVSNAPIGNVSPLSITTVLANGQTYNDNVSLTLPTGGALTNMVDVFLLFDDTGSFTANSPIVRAAFPQIISSLQTALPGIDLGFGVGRFEEYANYASEFAAGRPFILNQPIISSTTPGFSTSIQSALDRTAPGYGGDTPETTIEALYQAATGRGFDGNNNGTTSDSGAAGLVSTQLTPGPSGDVPSFASFQIDAAGNVLPASGSIGGAGFRPGALPIILTATDTGFAYQPKGETTVTGVNGLTLPISALTQASRPTTPFASGAGLQETVTALNALGALVIGLGTNPTATLDPRQGLESLAKLTGAINRSTATIANGTIDPIAPGDPLYFQIASGFSTSVSNGVVNAIQNAVTAVDYNITLKASDPRVQINFTPGVVNHVGAGGTAAFNITFTGDGRPHRFDLQFVREGTEVVLGSIPIVIGTPVAGEGYDYDDLDDGQIDDTTDFGNREDPAANLVVSSSYSDASGQALVVQFDHDVLPSVAASDFVVTNATTGAAVATTNFAYDSATMKATMNFAGGTLADGHYKLTIPSGALTGVHADQTLSFDVLGGDATHDGTVNFNDLLILAANYNTTGRTFAQGNFDYSPDGSVNFDDLLILASHYNTSLPVGAPAPLVAPPPAPAGASDKNAPPPVNDVLL